MKEYKDFLVDADLNIYNKFTGNKIRPFKGSDGYMAVKLNMKEHKTCERVHIIYANCFIPNPNGYKYINHIDSDKTNNSLNNLEWCTNSYNVQHSYNNGGDTNPIQVCVYKNGELIGTNNTCAYVNSKKSYSTDVSSYGADFDKTSVTVTPFYKVY